jgi:DNA-binding response OmpR family regulator
MVTVLVVDDNRNQRLLYEQELSAAGYRVILAEDSREAAEKFEIYAPDVAVVEVGGERLEGLDLIHRLQKYRQGTPLIANTARIDSRDLVRGLVDAYVVKSSDLTSLNSVIRVLLLRRRMAWRDSSHLVDETLFAYQG